ncbi:Scr1 family TA system antitoxin-like transcriptional regulator [Nocardiopsis sp. LOL_012]|uniref:Scr1 family TA system antitoxin-like transcriptional regulator n=1 Tax=Nocardiopsis sp. LOL_012 TaxID=3345409 RepID=UPI003A8639B7
MAPPIDTDTGSADLVAHPFGVDGHRVLGQAGPRVVVKVTVLVVPFEAGAHMAMDGAFSLLEFPSPEPAIVSISTGVESLYVEDGAYVDRHTLIFDGVHNLALDPKGSLDLIEATAAEHDKRA